MIDLREYDFPLPETLIARFPATPRDSSRLLSVGRQPSEPKHLVFNQIGDLLKEGDVLVLNQTRVLKARLFGESAKGRKFEVLLLAPEGGQPNTWRCLVRPGRYVEEEGTRLLLPGDWAATLRRSAQDDRQFEIDFPAVTQAEFLQWLDAHGTVPLPPYIKREADASDSQTYQTVYAQNPGSVAAPTAGLHFTPELLEALQGRGVQLEKVTLHIGYGTFSPLDPAATELHAESYAIEPDTYGRLQTARAESRRVIAVGTTSLRALESSATGILAGTTRIFIRPGYKFQATDGLITNFHLPQSSLFVLLCAFMGTGNAKAAYESAVNRHYRFFSYGDAMAVL